MPVKITRKYLNLSLDELTLGNGAFTLPTTDGTAGQALVTDGLGQVTFQDVSFSVTTNEIAYFTASGTIASLTTGTYPSLTELSYVKGVTSAIQTQLDNKPDILAIQVFM